ncbi:MAG: hypothetical protein EOO65_01175 [Methanosarcinales archaeon]|nr:MAG: hypothetical protein EOO65_01175 [Methanosarcinales archaeon]
MLTPTPSASPTITALTPTPSASPTITVLTPTPSASPTITVLTPTPSATATSSASPTNTTSTPTPSATATPTCMLTTTSTPTPTLSGTPSVSVTATASPTSSTTESRTVTPSASESSSVVAVTSFPTPSASLPAVDTSSANMLQTVFNSSQIDSLTDFENYGEDLPQTACAQQRTSEVCVRTERVLLAWVLHMSSVSNSSTAMNHATPLQSIIPSQSIVNSTARAVDDMVRAMHVPSVTIVTTQPVVSNSIVVVFSVSQLNNSEQGAQQTPTVLQCGVTVSYTLVWDAISRRALVNNITATGCATSVEPANEDQTRSLNAFVDRNASSMLPVNAVLRSVVESDGCMDDTLASTQDWSVTMLLPIAATDMPTAADARVAVQDVATKVYWLRRAAQAQASASVLALQQHAGTAMCAVRATCSQHIADLLGCSAAGASCNDAADLVSALIYSFTQAGAQATPPAQFITSACLLDTALTHLSDMDVVSLVDGQQAAPPPAKLSSVPIAAGACGAGILALVLLIITGMACARFRSAASAQRQLRTLDAVLKEVQRSRRAADADTPTKTQTPIFTLHAALLNDDLLELIVIEAEACGLNDDSVAIGPTLFTAKARAATCGGSDEQRGGPHLARLISNREASLGARGDVQRTQLATLVAAQLLCHEALRKGSGAEHGLPSVAQRFQTTAIAGKTSVYQPTPLRHGALGNALADSKFTHARSVQRSPSAAPSPAALRDGAAMGSELTVQDVVHVDVAVDYGLHRALPPALIASCTRMLGPIVTGEIVMLTLAQAQAVVRHSVNAPQVQRIAMLGQPSNESSTSVRMQSFEIDREMPAYGPMGSRVGRAGHYSTPRFSANKSRTDDAAPNQAPGTHSTDGAYDALISRVLSAACMQQLQQGGSTPPSGTMSPEADARAAAVHVLALAALQSVTVAVTNVSDERGAVVALAASRASQLSTTALWQASVVWSISCIGNAVSVCCGARQSHNGNANNSQRTPEVDFGMWMLSTADGAGCARDGEPPIISHTRSRMPTDDKGVANPMLKAGSAARGSFRVADATSLPLPQNSRTLLSSDEPNARQHVTLAFARPQPVRSSIAASNRNSGIASIAHLFV